MRTFEQASNHQNLINYWMYYGIEFLRHVLKILVPLALLQLTSPIAGFSQLESHRNDYDLLNKVFLTLAQIDHRDLHLGIDHPLEIIPINKNSDGMSYDWKKPNYSVPFIAESSEPETSNVSLDPDPLCLACFSLVIEGEVETDALVTLVDPDENEVWWSPLSSNGRLELPGTITKGNYLMEIKVEGGIYSLDLTVD